MKSFPEPAGGAHYDHFESAARLKDAVVRHLDEMKVIPIDKAAGSTLRATPFLRASAGRRSDVAQGALRARLDFGRVGFGGLPHEFGEVGLAAGQMAA